MDSLIWQRLESWAIAAQPGGLCGPGVRSEGNRNKAEPCTLLLQGLDSRPPAALLLLAFRSQEPRDPAGCFLLTQYRSLSRIQVACCLQDADSGVQPPRADMKMRACSDVVMRRCKPLLGATWSSGAASLDAKHLHFLGFSLLHGLSHMPAPR